MAEEILEPDLPICDPHHHLWDHPGSRYLLEELITDTGAGHRVESTVFVECISMYRAKGPKTFAPVGETEFVAGVAAMADSGRYGPIQACAAIVGHADLSAPNVEDVLLAHISASGGRFRGIRDTGAWDSSAEVRNGHTDPECGLYASTDFRRGFSRLAANGLVFEAYQYHPQLPELTDLARAFPETSIVLDHVGTPLGIGPYAGKRAEVFARWRADIFDLANSPNVVVKLGGLGMPICGFNFHKRATPASSEELAAAWKPYIETCIDAFGPERSMFESNFPVDRASCDYATLWNALKRTASGASAQEKALMFRDVARKTYQLSGE